MSRYAYGEYHEGPDPLAPPYDVAGALDALGDSVLEGTAPTDALRDLLRRGLPPGADSPGVRGLDELLRQARRRDRELRRSGRLDGILEQARALLDTAIGQERAELFPDPSDEARMREAELDTVPDDTARAIRQLSDYQWRSGAARQTFDKLREMIRRDVLDSRFRGMKQALESADPRAMHRINDMMRALGDMLDADARGEHTQADFDAFMREYGDLFPEQPADLEELVDQLARRSAAAQRLMASLSDEQQAELAALTQQAMAESGLAEQMARLSEALYARRPDLDWTGGERFSGDRPLGLGDATTALAELAEVSELETALGQDYPGARLDDIDEDAVRRALGRQAVDDLGRLRRIERELERQGYLQRSRGSLQLTAKAVRRLGQSALRKVFASLRATARGEHDTQDAGQAGERTGATRPWRFGDEQPLDVIRTLGNAVLRRGPGSPIALAPDDFEIAETEHRGAAAVCLLVDLSYSMALRGAWGAAKQTALALHALVTGGYPQDAIQVIGFSNYARVLQPVELAGLDWDMVQGTNLHHALLIAGRHLDRHPADDPVVLVITDGEPTAHLMRDGRSWFDWPPSPETLELTLAEVDKMTRRGATMNLFMLAEDERLVTFVQEVARRNGGRVFSPSSDRLGEYVVRDFLRQRRSRRAA